MQTFPRSSATASTDFGINRIGATAQVVYFFPDYYDPDSGFVTADAYSYSLWSDRLIVLGGSNGDSVTLSFHGTISYTLNAHGSIQLTGNNPDAQIVFSFQAGSSVIRLDTDDFASGQPLNWSFSIDAHSDQAIPVYSALHAQLSAGWGLGIGSGSKTLSFDSMHSSVLDLVTIDEGYSLGSESGELVNSAGGFMYRVAAVPEPQTYLMMAVGILSIFGVARRKLSRQQNSSR